MSTTTTGTSAASGQAPAPGARQAAGVAAASLPESLGVLLTGVVPALVRGLFAPRRGAMKLLSTLDTDARAIATLSKLRRKYAGDGIRMLRGKIVVLWGADAIKEVLDHSAELYAGDAGAKAKGMSHFQPDALTLSRGETWRNRRAFNESVLATSEWVHPLAQRFLTVVSDEVQRLNLGNRLQWSDWEQLFDHITLRVVFGDGAREDQELTGLLEKLMGESNRLVGLKRNDDYYAFYAKLEAHVRNPDPDSLIGRFAQAPQNAQTRTIQQIPHWIFAMRDTLGANAYRALAAIVVDTHARSRVREEVSGVDLTDPGAIERMRYLEGCLQEAMRLWPTTPLLARETTADATLVGEQLGKGTQVMLLNVFNHRDPEHVDDPDHLRPERWAQRERDYRFNHLSNGSQDCPGGPLVLLLGKGVIAAMLARHELELQRPTLDATHPLPKMLDFFEICFTVKSLTDKP